MKKVMFVCTGNYYRSIICENLWLYLLDRYEKDGEVCSSGLNPELASLWKKSFGDISPFAESSLNIMKVSIKRTNSLKPIRLFDIETSNRVIFLNKKEHKPMVAKSKMPTSSNKYIFWENEDVDSQFPLETIFSIIDNVCDLFQQEYFENTKTVKDNLKSLFFRKFKVFKDYKNSMMENI